MSRHLAALDLDRAVVDGDQITQVPAPIRRTAAGQTRLVGLAEGTDEEPAVVPAPDLPADLLAGRCSRRASSRWLNPVLRPLWMRFRSSVVNRYAA